MPPKASCCCPHHGTWGHSDDADLRIATDSEIKFSKVEKDGRHKGRKRKICVTCRNRIQLETKYDKLQKTVSDASERVDTEHSEIDDPIMSDLLHDASTQTEHSHGAGTSPSSCTHVLSNTPPNSATDQAFQAGPLPPNRPYQCYESRRRSDIRAEIIDQFHDLLGVYVHGDAVALSDLVDDLLESKKWSSTFGSPGKKHYGNMPSEFLSSLIKEYQECKRKESNQSD
ncbi:hypothetical protein OS493_018101 [Desmophyllum pertusum]|uniref:Uncharacterized protein n=1 Tax=Desmophyllum pertusum TaxID=174260 RepID=A0A9X0CKD8_9CNID|nr:hypothetical protein OS493_018101 [Desmophyllum pertusum]